MPNTIIIKKEEIFREILIRGFWKGYANIERCMKAEISKITFNSRIEVHKYLNQISSNKLNVVFLNEKGVN